MAQVAASIRSVRLDWVIKFAWAARLSVAAYKKGNGVENFLSRPLYISERPFLERHGIKVLDYGSVI
jgi:hypothetical protein